MRKLATATRFRFARNGGLALIWILGTALTLDAYWGHRPERRPQLERRIFKETQQQIATCFASGYRKMRVVRVLHSYTVESTVYARDIEDAFASLQADSPDRWQVYREPTDSPPLTSLLVTTKEPSDVTAVANCLFQEEGTGISFQIAVDPYQQADFIFEVGER